MSDTHFSSRDLAVSKLIVLLTRMGETPTPRRGRVLDESKADRNSFAGAIVYSDGVLSDVPDYGHTWARRPCYGE